MKCIYSTYGRSNSLKIKTKLTLLFLILLSVRTFGQLQADAGNDTILCVGMWGEDTTVIGGNPTATGGVEPYIYSWSIKNLVDYLYFPASLYLDDTTKSNPRLINYSGEDITFILTVIDNIGTQARDSITIRFSSYVYILTECMYFINQGDTVNLWGTMGGGIEPLSYTWFPNYNISDTTATSPEVWPDTTTNYEVYATDSIGCVSGTTKCWVTVNTTGEKPVNLELENSLVYPNPIDNSSIITIRNDIKSILSIHIINSIGQTILIDKIQSTSYLIGYKIYDSGVYFYVIKDKNKTISHGRFVKE